MWEVVRLRRFDCSCCLNVKSSLRSPGLSCLVMEVVGDVFFCTGPWIAYLWGCACNLASHPLFARRKGRGHRGSQKPPNGVTSLSQRGQPSPLGCQKAAPCLRLAHTHTHTYRIHCLPPGRNGPGRPHPRRSRRPNPHAHILDSWG